MGRQKPDLRTAVFRALRRMSNGTAGYRDMCPEDLLHAIGEAPLVEESSLPVISETLSDRERQVIDAVSHGMTNPMVAEHLGLALDTVKTHAKHVQAKLKAKNRTHAACIALREGVIK